MWFSCAFIEKRLNEFARTQNLNFYFPGSHRPQNFSTDEALNVVVYGDLFSLFKNDLAKVPTQMRAWVLCHKYAKYLQESYSLNRDQISVIPRSIFIESPKTKKTFSLEGFVFAGRPMLPSKRLRLAINLIQEMRRVSGKDFQFHVSPAGQFDSEYFYSLFPQKRFPWIHLDSHKASNWTSEYQNCAFISLSQFVFEDLGVAACEALSAGMPCVLSDWGGFSDFSGPQVLKLPPASGWDEKSELLFSKKFASSILDFLNKDFLSIPRSAPSPRLKEPRPISSLPFISDVTNRLDSARHFENLRELKAYLG